jgi:flagellar protein FlaF
MEAERMDKSQIRERMDALDWNRRMWSMLGNDCSLSSNGLPEQVRANIISLSIWVNKHTSLVMRNQEEIAPLIDINRIIMQGLAPAENAQEGMSAVRQSVG